MGNAICTNLGTCSYDDGNPVLDDENHLVGVISVNGGTFGCDYADVTLRVSPYVDWIREKTQGSN